MGVLGLDEAIHAPCRVGKIVCMYIFLRKSLTSRLPNLVPRPPVLFFFDLH